jgi:hypothetical protein
MKTLCTLKADLSGLRGSLKQEGGSGKTYYQVDFDIAVKFGGTQLQATIQWKEGVSVWIIIDINYHLSRHTGQASRKPDYHHSKCGHLKGYLGCQSCDCVLSVSR